MNKTNVILGSATTLLGLATLWAQFVIDDASLGGVGQAATDMASSLVQNLAKIFPVLVPVLVVAFIIGLVIGIIRRR